MSVTEHRNEAPHTAACMIITVSDTRTKEDDKSGRLISEFLESANYTVQDHRIVKDEYEDIQQLIDNAAKDEKIDAVLLNGGTGIAKRDTTYEAVQKMLEKEIPGFGELFRYLSYVEDIGSAAILSRAVAGVYHDTAIFSMPGSSGAVRLAMNKIIIPELAHVIREVRKDL
ncbi:MogA/MoaB family molybdenum cofactor biosynthesis protein [Alteribacillus bidgolensis]|uniref:Molybdenum cofactor biosynthesis protein B n=1 Tax=Alteribacillus bidgolensis TaxID=930129 RepID=A0A1G8QKM2_9BACI|nr:molybdenum cofactor biosynthesis protein B [Alteribacillus bidgolensis]SDJ04640.1 molybdopterin adenylyltransferase [Alteribacillus bidgolensis]